jgi:tRNA A37 threonylcarbamoyladenosine synthetase subunit TsaC/SUA5/YrdC
LIEIESTQKQRRQRMNQYLRALEKAKEIVVRPTEYRGGTGSCMEDPEVVKSIQSQRRKVYTA